MLLRYQNNNVFHMPCDCCCCVFVAVPMLDRSIKCTTHSWDKTTKTRTASLIMRQQQKRFRNNNKWVHKLPIATVFSQFNARRNSCLRCLCAFHVASYASDHFLLHLANTHARTQRAHPQLKCVLTTAKTHRLWKPRTAETNSGSTAVKSYVITPRQLTNQLLEFWCAFFFHAASSYSSVHCDGSWMEFRTCSI